MRSSPTPPPCRRPASSKRVGHGIHVVDTGFHRPRFDAAYLIVERGRAAFVDTGTNHSVPRLLAALEAIGLDVATPSTTSSRPTSISTTPAARAC